MPIPQLERRQYGFSAQEQSRKKIVKETPPARPKKQPTKRKPEKRPPWLDFLLALARTCWKLLLALWIGLRNLTEFVWERRPHVSRKVKKKFRKRFINLILVGGTFAVLFGVGTIAWMSKDLPDPDRLTDRKIAQSTKIYDRTGEHVLYEIFADEKRTLIQLDDLPEDLINGVIATEDTAFYEHIGIRPLSIARALIVGLLPGRRVAGTSTLTQQLVKNAILTDERRISRKIKEAILSLRLEQKYSKDQILQIYFNEIPYGSTNYGIESAAQSYFGKSSSDLTLAESATLAGLPKAPTTYLNNPEQMKLRRDFVLRRMFEEGYISEEEKNAAQAEELSLSQSFANIQAPHFVLHVKELLVEQYGEQVVETGGLKVITTLDWEKQQMAEKIFEEQGTELLAEAGANNLSLVSMDPKTGQILTMLGSKDFFDEDINGQFNVATLGKRQPGSSFKPIIYTAAFEKGYTPETVLFDVVTNFAASGRPYTPLNYNLQELGPVTIRQSLQGSLNIPAVKALYLVGPDKGIEFAQRLGYTTFDQGDFGLSLVLGGGEVRLVDHVAAYGVFANEGVKQEPTYILRVEDDRGDTMQEWRARKGKEILEPGIAATISNVLSDDAARAYAFGAGGVLTLPGRPVAAKTGTTNGYIDAWTVGYTPSLVTAVWAGNTNNSPMTRGFGGSRVAGPIWQEFMKQALANTPVESFPAPPKDTVEKPALKGSAGGAITLPINRITGRLATSSTPEQVIVQRTYTQPHSILHYVSKDDPRGPVPEDPTVDPQYEIWENAIQDWIRRKQEENPDWEIVFSEPPTEYDTEYSPELVPDITVIYPQASSTLTSRQIDTDIRFSAPRGVTKVTYQLNGKNIAIVRAHPFNLNYYAHGLAAGDHVLTVAAEDDIGNIRITDIPFTLSAPEEQPGVRWVQNNLRYSQSKFPVSLFLEPYKLEEIQSITIFGSKDGQGRQEVGTVNVNDVFNGQLVFVWNSADAGSWELEAVSDSGSSSQILFIQVDE